MTKTVDPFESISLDDLRKRTSEKWSTYGSDVLPVFVAEMDFALAPPVRAALQAAVALGDVGYAASGEVPAAFAAFARRRFGWDLDPGAVFAVPDVMAGVAEALQLLTPPGAGVVINPPVYPPFFDVIRHEGRTVVEAPLQQDSGGMWRLDLAALERAFSAGAQAYLLCSPHNPVGRVWSEAELRDVAALAARYHVAVISDEIHAPLTMPGFTFSPLLKTAPDQPVIALSSASKAFNIPGLKCAVMVATSQQLRADLQSRLSSRRDEVESRIGQLGVIATIAAFHEGDEWLDALLAHLDRTRHLLTELLGAHIPATRYFPPQATYLAWIDCSALFPDGQPADHFLRRGRVALEAGSKFGKQCASWARLNFGTSSAIVEEAVRRMARAV
jgi:cystathionine beta-lyase